MNDYDITRFPRWMFPFDNNKKINELMENRNVFYLNYKNTHNVGEYSVILLDNYKFAAIVKCISVQKKLFKNLKLKDKDKYREYFRKQDDSFSDSREVYLEKLELVKDEVKIRLNIALDIVKANNKIIGKLETIREIPSGYTNYLFIVNNKFVIKFCMNPNKGHNLSFEKDFYKEHNDLDFIPKFYKYDVTDKNKYPYIIIEYISGKSLFYHYYMLDENDKMLIIKEIVENVRKLQKRELSTNIKENRVIWHIKWAYHYVKKYFTKEENEKLDKAILLCEKILINNEYYYIHGDLHFDNILIGDDKLYFIDFNNGYAAFPFDFEYRFFYLCKFYPEDYADIYTLKYNKPKIFNHIMEYLAMYDERLSKYEDINLRMKCYAFYESINKLESLKYNQKDIEFYKKRVLEDANRILSDKAS